LTSEADTDLEQGTLHPRLQFDFFGHDTAEAELAASLDGQRLHHAWLVSGAKGLGKATLAYRFARRALGAKANPARPLATAPDDPVSRQVAALSHPDLFVLRRSLGPTGKPRQEITAEEARALPGFFSLKSASGGRRVAIVDCVDDLNRHAANALLKALEEPPAHALLILICHAPGAALATIRSRCRRLRLHPLDEATMQTAMASLGTGPLDKGVIELAGGRPGRAIALEALKAGAMRTQARAALAALWREGGKALAPMAFAGGPASQRLPLLIEIVQDWIRQSQLARAGLSLNHPSSADPALVAALSTPGHAADWAGAWQALEDLRAETEGLDLDPSLALARIAGILDRARPSRP
jgi:DNA polymerase-3 subunit delta'